MDFTGVIAKINPIVIIFIFMEISPYYEAEKVPLFRKNLVRACSLRVGVGVGGGVFPKWPNLK
jgi:hypothetical protein